MGIYWVVIEEVPTKKEEEEGKFTRIVVAPIAVSAKDEQDAAIRVAIGNEAIKGIDQNRLKVSVAPF